MNHNSRHDSTVKFSRAIEDMKKNVDNLSSHITSQAECDETYNKFLADLNGIYTNIVTLKETFEKIRFNRILGSDKGDKEWKLKVLSI